MTSQNTTAPSLAGHGRKLTGPTAVTSAIALAALAWQVISWLSGGWVPGLSEVFSATITAAQSPSFYADALVSLRRIAIIMVAATILGVSTGVLAGLSRAMDSFVRPLLVVALAIPDPVYIIMSILILGVSGMSGVVAVTVAITPLVANVVLSGVQDRDPGLDEMVKTYRFGWIDYLRHVLLPQIKPAMFASIRTAFAFAWKLVVLMEALAAADGIGAHIYNSFQLLRPDEMIAYALLFIIIMRILEAVAFIPVTRKTAKHPES